MKQAGQDNTKTRPKRAVAITAWTMMLLLAVGVLELALRIAMPQLGAEGWSAGVFCRNEALHYGAMVPHIEASMIGHEFGEITLHANSHGYRGEEWPGDDSLTVVLGDSFGWGWGVGDSLMWSATVGAHSAEPLANLSMPGDDWFRMQHRFRLHREELKAKHVVVLCYINDFFGMDDQRARYDSLNRSTVYVQDHVVLDGCEPTTVKGRFYPFNRLYVYKLARNVYRFYRQRNVDEGMSDYLTRIGYSDDARFLNSDTDFDAVCEGYVTTMREAIGEQPISFVYIPPVYAIDARKGAEVTAAAAVSLDRYRAFHQALERSFQDLPNTAFLDLHPSLEAAHTQAPVYYLNDGHLNANGHRVLGEQLAATILPHPPKKNN